MRCAAGTERELTVGCRLNPRPRTQLNSEPQTGNQLGSHFVRRKGKIKINGKTAIRIILAGYTAK